MAQATVHAAARHLQDHQVARQVGLQVVERLLDRIPHPGLGAEVHDAVDGGVGGVERRHGGAVGEVHPVELEAVAALERREAGVLQAGIVVVVQVVDADHPVAAVEQGLRDVHADEPGCSGNQNGHPNHPFAVGPRCKESA